MAQTFDFDDTLPPLPVPDLNVSIQSLLESGRALLTDEEQAVLERNANDFVLHAAKAQQTLTQLAAKRKDWYVDIWEEEAYLKSRLPNLPLVSIAMACPVPISPHNTQTEVAAVYMLNIGRYWRSLRKQQVPPTIYRKTVWSMKQFHDLFNSARVPRFGCDQLVRYFKTEKEGACPNHGIVFKRGNCFKIDMERGGELISLDQLEAQMRYIDQMAVDFDDQTAAICALTCADRDVWAKARHQLTQHETNRRNLEAIDSAIMIVFLTDQKITDERELLHNELSMDPRNQWGDKTITVHVNASAHVGMIGDHSNVDGIAVLQYNVSMQPDIERDLLTPIKKVNITTVPERLLFDLTAQILDLSLQQRVKTEPYRKNINIEILHYKGWGRLELRRHKLTPDTIVQIALQTAYIRLHGRPAPTYETASLRQFHSGRTETLRACTIEAVAFARAMVAPNSNSSRFALLKAAHSKHNQLMLDAMEFRACDRHLLALRRIDAQQGRPEHRLFTDATWRKLGGDGNFILSTSFLGNNKLYGLVAPMCLDCYGCFYSIIEDKIAMGISTWATSNQTNIRAFKQVLIETFDDFKPLILFDNAKM